MYIWKFRASNSDILNMLDNGKIKLEEGKVYYDIPEKILISLISYLHSKKK